MKDSNWKPNINYVPNISQKKNIKSFIKHGSVILKLFELKDHLKKISGPW